jgi:3-methyladenine DNA glycosylase AlkD
VDAAAEDVVARLRSAFEAEADAEWAVGAAAYMRNQFPFLGVRTPARRRLAKTALAGLPTPDEPRLAALARALWRQPQREFQYAGCDLLAKHVRSTGPGFIEVVHELVVTKAWWDTVDALAAHTAGPLVRNHPGLTAVMDDWIRSDDIWVARTAILHQLTYRDDTDGDRLFAYCRLRAGDPEFFIRKAIGWALRTYAAHEPDRVAEFLRDTDSLSPLSIREATRGVERARRGVANQRRRREPGPRRSTQRGQRE